MLMRLIAGLVAILPAIVIFSGVIASAETPRKHSLIEAIGLKELVDWPPNGPDVLRVMHQFDMFQIQAAGSADSRGNNALRQFALEQANLARERDQRIAKLNTFTVLGIDFPNRPSVLRNNRLAGLQGSVGREFIRDFHDKQVEEFRRAIGLLRRYLRHPDNELIGAFARDQLPLLQDGLAVLKAHAPS
jgi:predicted outer membrane protein